MALSDGEILELLLMGVYSVDLDTGIVSNQAGKELKPLFGNGSDKRYPAVRLHYKGKSRWIGLSKVVWMAGSRSLPPSDYDIHHRNRVVTDCRWDNLVCIHREDHKKLHLKDLLNEDYTSNDTPF